MSPLRVLVVEDSATVRAHLRAALEADPEIVVAGEAEDGRRAIELCRDLRPDVVTLDMMLPVMTGLAVTEYVMAYCPTPILIVSSSVNRGELFRTYDALAAGAVDVLEKPRGDESDAGWEERFVRAVKMVARIRVITHPRARLARPGAERPAIEAPAAPLAATAARNAPAAVAIGASTGGPGALVEILRGLHAPYRFPLLVVVHIGELFAQAFVDWLDGQSEHRATFAQDGQPLAAVRGIAMAPPDRHMVLANGRLRLMRAPERHSCRPSIDVLFESLASELGPAAAACLLTGMGKDGAAGLLAVRRAGGATIAQDEATSVVYGMPREAVALGAAARVLPIGEIAPALAALATHGGGEEGARR